MSKQSQVEYVVSLVKKIKKLEGEVEKGKNNMSKESYDKGFKDALYAYAWMKEGVSYVGSGIRT